MVSEKNMIKKTYSFEKSKQTIDVYTLSNANGMEADVCTYGARLTRISVPDKNGVFDDVLVGCKRVEDYCDPNPYFGATIGRYGNRIGGARFTLNGKEYRLEANDNDNHLHGGISANFDSQIWEAKMENDALALYLVSPNGAGGYPGTLKVKVVFSLSDDNALTIDYFAETDEDTLCNLTNHAYFNLSGEDTVLDHELMINAKYITPTDDKLIPDGTLMPIDNTPYSFLPAKTIGKDTFSSAHLIKLVNGFDFNYCLDRKTAHDLEHCAYIYDKKTGRKMDCYTTLPGLQLYTGCSTGGFQGKKAYVNHCAVCLETQGFPNSPNCPQYPSTVLKAGETYRQTTVYQFSIVQE
jgi:aldose 1-epimerase